MEHKIVSREEWIEARKALLATKKPLRVNRRARSQIAEILGEPV